MPSKLGALSQAMLCSEKDTTSVQKPLEKAGRGVGGMQGNGAVGAAEFTENTPEYWGVPGNVL